MTDTHVVSRRPKIPIQERGVGNEIRRLGSTRWKRSAWACVFCGPRLALAVTVRAISQRQWDTEPFANAPRC